LCQERFETSRVAWAEVVAQQGSRFGLACGIRERARHAADQCGVGLADMHFNADDAAPLEAAAISGDGLSSGVRQGAKSPFCLFPEMYPEIVTSAMCCGARREADVLVRK
jgi:hypothetical protein